MNKDYEYEYELPDHGRITYPGSGYVSPYVSDYKPHKERITKPQPQQKTDEELIQEAEKEAMQELINLRNKSTVTAALTIKSRYDSHHPKKPMTEEKALQMAMRWWDKKNPEFSYAEYPVSKNKAPTIASAERKLF